MYKLYAKQSLLFFGILMLYFSAQAQGPTYYNSNVTGSSCNSFPFSTSGVSQRIQWLILPNEYTGVTAGKAITTLWIKPCTGASTTYNLVIKLGHSNLTSFTAGSYITTGMTTVFSGNITLTSTANTWLKIPLQTPFPYDITKSLIIDINNVNGLTGFTINQYAPGGNRRLYNTGASSDVYSLVSGIDVKSLGANNAGLAGTNMYNCPGTFDITATIENVGINQIKSVKVNWTKNGVAQTQYSFSGTLDTSGGYGSRTATVTLGQHTWSTGNSLDLKIWTSSPNNVADTSNDNDTLKVTIKPSMKGTFTVGASGANYTTLSAAINDLVTYGICGPVTINVAAGTYTGQVIIPQINGSSATNTITIKGAGKSSTILTSAGTSTANMQTLLLNGADYVTVQDMTIENTGVSFGVAVMLTNNAEYNTIQDCDIKAAPTATSTTTGGIAGTGVSTSLTTAGGSGNYNSFLRNNITGGYYGITFWGPGTGQFAMGNRFIDNTITNYYSMAMYLYYGAEMKVIGNKINSPRTGMTTAYGIYFYYQSNFEIARNEVTTSYYALYGYYANYINYNSDGTRSTLNNNILNSTNLYGVSYYYMYFTEMHHNTIRSNSAYTAYFSNAIQSDISSNIFWNASTGYAFYSTVGNYSALDYNIYYAPSSTTPLYSESAYTSLAAWQSAVSDFNSHSWQQDPMLNSATDLHITQTTAVPYGPQRSYTTDVDGNGRCIFAPTIGADESSLGKNMQPKAGILGPDTIFVNSPSEFLGNRTPDVAHGNRWYINDVLMKDSLDFMATIKSTGTYTIKVVAYSCIKKDSTTKKVVVVNPTAKPSPDFIASKNGLRIGDAVYFTDLTSGGPSSWSWDITPKTAIDLSGTVSTYTYIYGSDVSQAPGVRFTQPGVYKVCLTATNSVGSASICKQGYIRVYHSSKLGTTTTLVNDSSGYIYDHAGAKTYYNNSMVTSMLIAPCASEVYLMFNTFELECGWDYVRIYDGENNKGTPLHPCTNNMPTTGTTGPGLTGTTGSTCVQYCAPKLTDTFIAKSGKMFIEMAADGNTTFDGFEAFFWSKSKYVAPPKAEFSAPSSACMNVRVDFDNKTTGDGVTYAWDLDGNLTTFEATSPKAFYTYPAAGTYKVTLLAFNCGGIDTFQQNITIFKPKAPDVNFTADNVLPTTLDIVKFSANIAECVNDYFWRIKPKSGTGKADFVNSTKATSANPQVTFSDTGCYSVFLYAKNAGGEDSLELSCYIRVKNPYCIPTVTTNVADIGISEVSIIALNDDVIMNKKSTQGVDDYQNFVSTVSGTIESGVSYDLKVSRASSLNTVTRTAWIDWNLDGDFVDAGEKIAEEKKSASLEWKPRFTVPLTAKYGATMMRIAVNQGNLTNSVCGPNKYGEYEDYRIYITPDRTRPEITLIDNDTVYVEQGYPYTEAGATAEDNLDGDISGKLLKTETPAFNNATIGTYLIQYNVEDAAGNKAITATRIVYVTPDVTKPVLEVSDKDTVHIAVGDNTYTEPVATKADDILDGDILNKVVKVGAVNINKVGMYTLTYSVSDKAGNTSSIIRIVIVGDDIAPVIALKGSDTVYNEVNTTYTDGGVTYTDNYCSSAGMTGNLVVTSNVDETTPGTYSVVYNLTDCNGNKAIPVIRTVIIQDTKAPEVTLTGDSLVVLDVHNSYTDEGVTSSDNYGTPTTAVSGSFFTNFPNGQATNLGDYTIIYTVTDNFGNTTIVSRTIRVVDRKAPVINLKDIPNVNVCRWAKYTDAGYDLSDNFWPAASIKVTQEGDFLVTGTQVRGVYSFRYKAVDSSGNVAYSEWRVINVREAGTGACQTGLEENANLENAVRVYPNPTTGRFIVDFNLDAAKQVSVKVVNSLGQAVATVSEGSMSAGTLSVDLSSYSSGMYMVHITAGSQAVVKRIMVAR